LFLRDYGDTEVGGFGVSRRGDLLLVEDFCLVQQRCTPASVTFSDESVADYFDRQVDQLRVPAEFARIWIHTHPGDSAAPSLTDELTFERCFGEADWAVMLIVARGGQVYARQRFNAGPGGAARLAVGLDFLQPFPATNCAAWQLEYQRQVRGAAAPEPAAGPSAPDPAADFSRDWREAARRSESAARQACSTDSREATHG
jgi:proteasome lid subunit RPN8/RPN11